jgi:hypothetical protein
MSKARRRPAINPSFFGGQDDDEKAAAAPAATTRAAVEARELPAPAGPEVERPVPEAPAEQPQAAPPPSRPPRALAPAVEAVQPKRYERLHLYATPDMRRQVRVAQSEALAEDVPLGQRGTSVIMAAALDHFMRLPRAERVRAISAKLGR